jgi:peptidoglycan hydrolase-like protein with peptidoglycan-binding domain
MLGHLDPFDSLTGLQQRLNNVGYPCGDPDGTLNPQTIDALTAFQRAHGLPADGKPTPDTQQKLRSVNGA